MASSSPKPKAGGKAKPGSKFKPKPKAGAKAKPASKFKGNTSERFGGKNSKPPRKTLTTKKS